MTYEESTVIGGRSCGKTYKIINELQQENTKLKAENEQLKEDYNILARQYNNVENSSIRYYNEVKQLKAELEQSVKLPCKAGDKIWWLNGKIVMESEVVSFCIDEDGVSIIHIKYLHDKEKDRWYGHNLDILNIGKTIFLTQEEAEQSLKG